MVRKILLAGGILSSLLYVIGIDVIAALRYPDYHNYADQMVSELLAVGAPTRVFMVWLCIPYNFLVFAFAVGVWESAGGKRATRLTAAALIGYGAVSTAGLLLFPMDVRGTVASQRDALHIIATIVMSIFIVAAMAFGAFAHGRRFRLYSFATIATVVVFGAWAGFLARPMPGPTPWLGLAERVNIYATMLWFAILAVALLSVHKIKDASHIVVSRDGTRIGYLSVGEGPSVLVIPGVLSMASDYAAFARALSQHFAVHIIERRGRGESGPQGDGYSIVKECEDVLAVQAGTGASLLVGHSYGGLVALEVARNNKTFTKIAVYEPGVSIGGSMPTAWMPGYEKKLAERRHLDALVEFTLADAPPRIQKTPRWLMKLLLLLLVTFSRQYRQMLGLLHQNLREWREIARLDSSCDNYREIAGGVLLMYGGRSDSKAVTLSMERLAAILPHSETKEFPGLDHFGIERTAPREVAQAVSDYFLK